MDQVLDITMCAGAIGGSLKLKIVFLCAQNQERPPSFSGNLFLILFSRAFSFAPLIDRYTEGAVSATALLCTPTTDLVRRNHN